MWCCAPPSTMACSAAKLHQISSDSGCFYSSDDGRMGLTLARVIDAAVIQVRTSVLSDGDDSGRCGDCTALCRRNGDRCRVGKPSQCSRAPWKPRALTVRHTVALRSGFSRHDGMLDEDSGLAVACIMCATERCMLFPPRISSRRGNE